MSCSEYEHFKEDTKKFIYQQSNTLVQNLIYACNQNFTVPPRMDTLCNSPTILMLFHIPEIDDAYITLIPVDVCHSSIIDVMIFTRSYFSRFVLEPPKMSLLDNDLMYLVTADSKFIYNYKKHELYIEGLSTCLFHFFRTIKRKTVSANLRIYKTQTFANAIGQDTILRNFHKGQLNFTAAAEKPKYINVSVPWHDEERSSHGLILLKRILSNTKPESLDLFTTSLVYRTGITSEDMRNFDKTVLNLNWGFKAEKNSIHQCGCKNFTILFQMKDSFIAVVYYTYAKYPFMEEVYVNHGVFIFMNPFCYYIGRFNSRLSMISWNTDKPENMSWIISDQCYVNNGGRNGSNFCFLNNRYSIQGDFRLAFETPIAFTPEKTGQAKVHYFTDTDTVLKYFDNEKSSLRNSFI